VQADVRLAAQRDQSLKSVQPDLSELNLTTTPVALFLLSSAEKTS